MHIVCIFSPYILPVVLCSRLAIRRILVIFEYVVKERGQILFRVTAIDSID